MIDKQSRFDRDHCYCKEIVGWDVPMHCLLLLIPTGGIRGQDSASIHVTSECCALLYNPLLSSLPP